MKRTSRTEGMDPRSPFAPRRGPVSQSLSRSLDMTAAGGWGLLFRRAAGRFWTDAARLDKDQPLDVVPKRFFVVAGNVQPCHKDFQQRQALCRPITRKAFLGAGEQSMPFDLNGKV